MNRPALALAGCTTIGQRLLEHLPPQGFAIDAVICPSPEMAQRLNISGYVDLAPLARGHGIEVYRPEKYTLKHANDLEFFASQKFDVLLPGGWQRLIPDEVLATFAVGSLGVHGSSDRLPKGRGRSPLNWSLIEGRRRCVLHLFIMKPGIDDGDIIDEEWFDITPFDTIATLYLKNAIVTERMLARRLPELLAGTAVVHQQVGTPSYYAKRTPADGAIDWDEMDVWQVYNMVRALTRPYPGAFAQLDGERTTIWDACVFDTRITYPSAGYGDTVERSGEGLVVNCRGGLLLIKSWEPRSADV